MTPEERASAVLCAAIDAGEFRDDPRLLSKMETRITAAIRDAVEAEREACAQIAIRYRDRMRRAALSLNAICKPAVVSESKVNAATTIANRIRERTP